MTGLPPLLDAAAVAVRPRLPAPARTRWQPLRLGLINLYRFDDECFAFEDGRLLLRGNNGTGKSRVLALTLPFLFDGRIEPHRVEPDGDPAKRMEWNLLLGRYDDRLGYAWLEFGRRDEPDAHRTSGEDRAPGDEQGASDESGAHVTDRFITIGCGMRASAGRGAPRTWFFVTDRRVGDDLQLIADTGQALTRERLAEAIGDRGQVIETATEYRRLVDRALFGLGEHRYAALVDLLVQLRRPQLSRQLDESLLSQALSEALPPLSAAVVADVADAFRALDEDRGQLEGFEAALQATASFLTYYRTYAAVAARRRATAVTQTHARYERTRAELRDAERARDEAAADVVRLGEERAAARDAERAATVQVRTLESSPEMQAARELDTARTRATELATAAGEREEDLRRAGEELRRREDAFAAARSAADTTRPVCTAAHTRASADAEATGLALALARALAPLELPDVRDRDVVATARRALDEAVARTTRAAEHLVALDGAVREAATRFASARERLDERSAEFDHARDAATDAATRLGTARDETVAALRRWAAELVELDGLAVDAVADALREWDGSGTAPAAAAAEAAYTAARRRLAREDAAVEVEADELAAEHVAITAERDVLAAGAHRPPPAPHTRDPAARDGRPGAPLWQLVEPAPGLDAAQLAGYEAALEAAGLLDAWVTADGALLDADDTVLVAAGTAPRADGGLLSILAAVPAETGGVPTHHVTAILARISARVDGDIWVAADGRWRVGPLHGRWHKNAAEHLGHPARERARLARIAQLDARLAELDAAAAEVERRRGALQERATRVDRERASAPREEPIREAVWAAASADAEVRRHGARVAEAEEAVRTRHDELDRAVAERDLAAADLGLAGRAADPAALLTDLAACRGALAELWSAVTAHMSALDHLDTAVAERDGAAAERERRAVQAHAARTAADDAATRRDTLEDAVGRTAAEIIARLDAARAQQQELSKQLDVIAEQREARLLARQSAVDRVKNAAGRLSEVAAQRADDVERFRRLARAGFLPTAGVAADAESVPDDVAWAPDPAVRTARRVNEALASTPAGDADWDRVQRGLHGHYTTLEHALLPHALQPTAFFDDDLFVVTAGFQGRVTTMPELHDLLADEVGHRRGMLDAREREVLENHLVGEVATQLHELIRQGEKLVNDMNDELAVRPTSTGMRLRFAWQPRADGPEAFTDARRRLLAADHVWSAEDRDALGRFLHARIREVREADGTGSWPEHLTLALDYRRWHVFAIEREQEGAWVRLTRRTHGTGSGGEKALALTVPQFAAAAAHYRSADPHAPRLIALDEAFVGIDSDMRAKCLDLLVRFDLDVVMTSEREWACYPTVPAITICQLATRPGIDAIGVHRWVWNGRDRLHVRIADGRGTSTNPVSEEPAGNVPPGPDEVHAP